jgi:hemerythrin superfamily protein
MVTRKSKSAGAPGNLEADAVAMLMADHKQVKSLFREFASVKEKAPADEDQQKADIVKRICTELTIHAELEEEIFYPAVRQAIKDEDLMDEALVEHAGAKELIAQLEGMETDDDLYDAKVTVLGEQIDHHVKEEEGEMFPKAKKAQIDIDELGRKMAERKAELKANLDDLDTANGGGGRTRKDSQPTRGSRT